MNAGRSPVRPEPAPRYELRIRGNLGATVLAAFPNLEAEAGAPYTILTGIVPDQAALQGLLIRLEELGLELLEVRRLPRS